MTLIEKAGYIFLYLLRSLRFTSVVLVQVITAFISGAAGLALATVCVWLMLTNPETTSFGDFLRFLHSPVFASMVGIGGVASLVLRFVFNRRSCCSCS